MGHLVTRVDTVLKYGISNVNFRDGTNMTSVHKVEMISSGWTNHRTPESDVETWWQNRCGGAVDLGYPTYTENYQVLYITDKSIAILGSDWRRALRGRHEDLTPGWLQPAAASEN